jgi:rhodanese-related sulfurtransferase
MAHPVDTAEAARLHGEGACFVEVLPASAYEEQHVPGAVNVPLTELSEAAVADLDRQRTTVVYCYDYQCDLSARAAARLERLGFTDVRDYVASKAAWMAAGLSTEAMRSLYADRVLPKL